MNINPDRVSKFVAIHGPRGACKTLYLSSIGCYYLKRYYLLKLLTGEDRHVWSNYPIAFKYAAPGMKPVELHSLPLNMEAFYTFDEELSGGWALIDEIDQWLDRQDWSAVTSKLINKGMTQIRKKKLSISCTLQDFDWLNNRADFQTDILVHCREAAFTPWGRERGLDLGVCSFLSFVDLKGYLTGYEYRETGMEYQQVFQGQRFWGTYNTEYVFDPMTTQTKYKIKRPEKSLVVGPDGITVQDNDFGRMIDDPESDYGILGQLVDELKQEGKIPIRTHDFWLEAKSRGVKGSSKALGSFVIQNLALENNHNRYVVPKEREAALVR